jgi:hypothetical protein
MQKVTPMPTQHNPVVSRNGSAALPPDSPRSPGKPGAAADPVGAPLPGWVIESQDRRPGVAEPMNDHDQALQNHLVLLLSTLEQHRARLDKAFHQGEPVAVLDLARAMVDEVVKAAERLGTADGAALTAALADAGDLFTTLDRVRKEFEPSLIRSVLAVFGKSRTSPEQKRQEFRQTLADTFRVLETFLGLFRGDFQSETAAQEWGQASGLFLHDLSRVVPEVNA